MQRWLNKVRKHIFYPRLDVIMSHRPDLFNQVSLLMRLNYFPVSINCFSLSMALHRTIIILILGKFFF